MASRKYGELKDNTTNSYQLRRRRNKCKLGKEDDTVYTAFFYFVDAHTGQRSKDGYRIAAKYRCDIATYLHTFPASGW